MDPTSGSNFNLVFEPGARDFDALLRSMKKGILVTGFTGGNCNGSTGDFSFEIDGCLVENGERTQPVSEMNITGNMKQLWMSLVEAGSDIRTDSAWRTPSLLFDNVDFSGI
jgi:PmbA protein